MKHSQYYTDLIHQGAQESISPLFTEEALCIIDEDLMEAVQHILQKQTTLRHIILFLVI